MKKIVNIVIIIGGFLTGVFWWTPESRILTPEPLNGYHGGLYYFGNLIFLIGISMSFFALLLRIWETKKGSGKWELKKLALLVIVFGGMFILGAYAGIYILDPRMGW